MRPFIKKCSVPNNFKDVLSRRCNKESRHLKQKINTPRTRMWLFYLVIMKEKSHKEQIYFESRETPLSSDIVYS